MAELLDSQDSFVEDTALVMEERGLPRIAGRKASDIVQFMREYRSGAWPSSVMGRIAKGFDDQQIDAIAAWFAAQPE